MENKADKSLVNLKMVTFASAFISIAMTFVLIVMAQTKLSVILGGFFGLCMFPYMLFCACFLILSADGKDENTRLQCQIIIMLSFMMAIILNACCGNFVVGAILTSSVLVFSFLLIQGLSYLLNINKFKPHLKFFIIFFEYSIIELAIFGFLLATALDNETLGDLLPYTEKFFTENYSKLYDVLQPIAEKYLSAV